MKTELLIFVVLLNADGQGESFKGKLEMSKMTAKVTPSRPKIKKEKYIGLSPLQLGFRNVENKMKVGLRCADVSRWLEQGLGP